MAFDSQQLGKIRTFLRRNYIDNGRFPGTVTRVLHRGATVFEDVQGLADVETRRPLRPDSLFRIYSMTKPITSIALMMLVEEGRIELADPVARYIPSFAGLGVYRGGTLATGFETVAPARPMLVIDLLRHTSGLAYAFQQRTNVDAAYRALGIGGIEAGTRDLGQFVATLSTLPLEFSPGEAWNYSVATDVLGFLIQKIADEPFDHFLERRIFQPLGMADTGFSVAPERRDRLASCYQVGAGGRDAAIELADKAEASPFLHPPVFLSGGGGLVSSADDYLCFMEALRTGAPRLVGRKTLELMTANHLPGGRMLPELSRSGFSEATYDGIGFGLGFATTEHSTRTMTAGSNGSYFWGGVASTAFWIDPAEELSVLFLTQLIPSTSWPIRSQLRSLVYGALA